MSMLPAEFRAQSRTQLEMQGMHLAKVLRALVWLRKQRGQSIGERSAWTTILAEVTAAIVGPSVDARRIANKCTSVGFEPDAEELYRAAKKARLARADDGYRIMSSKNIGLLIGLTSEEKAELAERLNLKKIFIIAIDATEARREKQKFAAMATRRIAGAPKRAESKSALARRLGVHRSTLYRRPNATVTSPVPMGSKSGAEIDLKNATVTSPLPGECDSYVAAPLSTETGDVCVAQNDVVPTKRRAS